MTTRTREDTYRAYVKRHELVVGGPLKATWLDGGAAFWYASEDGRAFRVDARTGERTRLGSEPVRETESQAPPTWMRSVFGRTEACVTGCPG